MNETKKHFCSSKSVHTYLLLLLHVIGKPERRRERKQLSLAFSVNVHHVTTHPVNVVPSPNICAIFLCRIRQRTTQVSIKARCKLDVFLFF